MMPIPSSFAQALSSSSITRPHVSTDVYCCCRPAIDLDAKDGIRVDGWISVELVADNGSVELDQMEREVEVSAHQSHVCTLPP
jgi:hypothetical protein